jgi:hypothetical protein
MKNLQINFQKTILLNLLNNKQSLILLIYISHGHLITNLNYFFVNPQNLNLIKIFTKLLFVKNKIFTNKFKIKIKKNSNLKFKNFNRFKLYFLTRKFLLTKKIKFNFFFYINSLIKKKLYFKKPTTTSKFLNLNLKSINFLNYLKKTLLKDYFYLKGELLSPLT